MLQMRKHRILLIVLLLFAGAGAGDSLSMEWLFQNEYDNELIKINEAIAVVPEELHEAYRMYREGAYRRASDILEQVRKLYLPDGSLDLISFMLGECYRKLDLKTNAKNEYRFVASQFPRTDKKAPALYRLLEYSAEEGNTETCDSIRSIFELRFSGHPLYFSVLYECAKLYFRQELYGVALEILEKIAPHSQRYMQSRFLSALCLVQRKEWDGALRICHDVWKRARSIDMKTEAMIVMGDIHYKQNHVQKAMSCYRKVPAKAKRYEYAQVKIARCLYDMGKFEKAMRMTNRFLNKRSSSPYFFEMASILEQAYLSLGKKREAREVGSRIHRQIAEARITFEIYDEIDRLTDMIKRWQVKEADARLLNKGRTLRWAEAGRKKTQNLQGRVRRLLKTIDQSYDEKKVSSVPHIAERRYISLLKKKMESVQDTLTLLGQEVERSDSLARMHKDDSSYISMADSVNSRFEEQWAHYKEIEHEHALIIDECLGGEVEGKQINEEMQAKFIDWEFMKYLALKKNRSEMATFLTEKKRNEGREDTLKKDSSTVPDGSALTDSTEVKDRITETTLAQLTQAIDDERNRLISHSESMLDIYPKSRYAPGILFRLAELYFDAAGYRFQNAMAVYENNLMTSTDTAELDFPEYDLRKAVKTYYRIVKEFPKDRYADNALFYAALALKKQGMEDSAQAVMLSLVDKYPKSEYYIEANMNIGRYHFEHPKKFGGDGYKKAEAAFRNVLFYRDHPQFVQALYHLGWCYYMQDRYDEAIAAFKYMIQEVELDFDPKKKDEGEIKNPLLRSEAIDYLAISFDQDDAVGNALQFLRLIGNNDYASLVLNRMGELREEDLDYERAIRRYRMVTDSFPYSYRAPEAVARIIKLHENANNPTAADYERERFITSFGAGSNWHRQTEKRDSALVKHVDSMVIAIGLSMADNVYRTAQEGGGDTFLRSAAEKYRRIVEMYPEHPQAADAAWNLAALLDKIGDKPGAYQHFITFSRYPGIEKEKRETAALNAVAIAQSLLPPDSLVKKGAVGFTGKKLIAAVENYLELFPEGNAYSDVLFSQAGVFFNRKLFQKAAEIYRKVIDAGLSPEVTSKAMLLLAQCRFGDEEWDEAIPLFEKVWKKSPVDQQRNEAITFLLQSKYFRAKKMMEDGKYDKAAIAFKEIDEKFEGSEYGDVAQFNAAEAYEKQEQWIKACERYSDLVKRYPHSKFAPDALFNAAGDYEKAERFTLAAQTYEKLVAQYPHSERAKDGLFNLGFCYEKMGKIDAMVSANERFSMLYPEEKDVEALLLRSANYYAKTGMLDKAINLYSNFIRRFPHTSAAVEAYYMIGKCQYDRGDLTNAKMSFKQAEQHNERLLANGEPPNNFHASEAALHYGNVIEQAFKAIRLELPESRLKEAIKEKAALVTDAVGTYERVVRYQSKKMFEAACRIGLLYETFAHDIAEQERPRTDPIKDALNRNINLSTASQMLQNSFLPFRKTMELAQQLDSLSAQQEKWVVTAREHLGKCILQTGDYLYEGVSAMQHAPIPAQIDADPLLRYQYEIKLLETLEPQKLGVLNYFTQMLDSLPRLKLDDSLTIACEINVVRLNYLIGSGFDKLATEILKETEKLPKKMSESEREELLFQLEDIVFELQDLALMKLEDARKRVVAKNLQNNLWFNKILETLARLSPDRYGASFYRSLIVNSDETWICRNDSVQYWNTGKLPRNGWSAVYSGKKQVRDKRKIPRGTKLITGDTSWNRMYLVKNAFCNGVPRKAKVYLSVPGKYRMYINGVLTLSDTTGSVPQNMYDSATSIVSLFKGGDNLIACSVEDPLSVRNGIAFSLMILVDTVQQFSSKLDMPKVEPRISTDTLGDTLMVSSKSGKAPIQEVADAGNKEQRNAGKKKVLSRKEVLAQIEMYRERERKALAALRRERLEIQKLRILIEERKRKQGSPVRSTSPASIPAR